MWQILLFSINFLYVLLCSIEYLSCSEEQSNAIITKVENNNYDGHF